MTAPALTDPLSRLRLHESAHICATAILEGDIEIGSESSVWHHAVLRADFGHIRIGRATNIQENVVVHMSPGGSVDVGDFVSVGHGAILHGCVIEEHCIIGMGAIVMNDVHIGKGSIVGAGSVVHRGTYPANSLIVDTRVVRQTTHEDHHKILRNAIEYAQLIKRMRAAQEGSAS